MWGEKWWVEATCGTFENEERRIQLRPDREMLKEEECEQSKK